MAQDGAIPTHEDGRVYCRLPVRAAVTDAIHLPADPMQTPRGHPAVNGTGAQTQSSKLVPVDLPALG